MSNSTLRLPGRIAVFAVAHVKYWAQFPTLRGKLQEYHSELCKKLTDFGAEEGTCSWWIVLPVFHC